MGTWKDPGKPGNIKPQTMINVCQQKQLFHLWMKGFFHLINCNGLSWGHCHENTADSPWDSIPPLFFASRPITK